ncbi:MAG: 30S ribosomal protein S21 [Kiritimatiellae bacterium]|nr:30S ribosomal protein S21 [Kiritimatiellia bacterium]
MAIVLKLKKGESVERGLKRMKKILDKEGLLKTIRDQRYFEKPCVKARKKSQRAASATVRAAAAWSSTKAPRGI